jgi:Transglutaminase-like superfamily
MNFFHFELEAFHYAARCRDRVVLLRAGLDTYTGLSPGASIGLVCVLTHRFFKEKGLFVPALGRAEAQASQLPITELNEWAAYFVQRCLIRVTTQEKRRNRIAYPQDETGLGGREWSTQKALEVPLDRALAFKALITLHKVHGLLKKQRLMGALGFLASLASLASPDNRMSPSPESYSLAAARALEAACLIYPKKTTCLPFAVTLAALHYQRQYTCDFVIGVQNLPFYAHAWVEVEGKVICDTQDLKEKLALILRFNPELGVL